MTIKAHKGSHSVYSICLHLVFVTKDRLVASLKGASSRIIPTEFAEVISKIYSKPVFWSGSYYVASCSGAPIEKIRKYIETQDKPEDWLAIPLRSIAVLSLPSLQRDGNSRVNVLSSSDRGSHEI